MVKNTLKNKKYGKGRREGKNKTVKKIKRGGDTSELLNKTYFITNDEFIKSELLKLNINSLTKFLMMPGKTKFDFINFIKQFITWIFIIIITYIFIKVAFEGLLGVKGT